MHHMSGARFERAEGLEYYDGLTCICENLRLWKLAGPHPRLLSSRSMSFLLFFYIGLTQTICSVNKALQGKWASLACHETGSLVVQVGL